MQVQLTANNKPTSVWVDNPTGKALPYRRLHGAVAMRALITLKNTPEGKQTQEYLKLHVVQDIIADIRIKPKILTIDINGTSVTGTYKVNHKRYVMKGLSGGWHLA